ncbi:hypothetical protein KY385_01070 [Candidatus Parcubacteria bacterium]|nr:hypothetical protein [Candidatus Parcubacteria bacterium]
MTSETDLPTQSTPSLVEQLGTSQVMLVNTKHNAPWPFAEYNPRLNEQSNIMARAMGSEAIKAFKLHEEPTDPNVVNTFNALAQDRPAYVPVEAEELTQKLQDASEAFGADSAGMIVKTNALRRPMFGTEFSYFNTFAALQIKSKPYRLLAKEGTADIETIERAFSLLAPPSSVATANGNTYAAVEFVEKAEHPTSLTEDELADWTNRFKQANVDIGLDIGDDDVILDNFVRHNGKLYWCDGNLMGAKQLALEKAADYFAQWQAKLEKFVETI